MWRSFAFAPKSNPCIRTNKMEATENGHDQEAIEKERQEWARQMRLRFTPKEMLHEDGSIDFEYAPPFVRRNPCTFALSPCSSHLIAGQISCVQILQAQERQREAVEGAGEEVGRQGEGPVAAGHRETRHWLVGTRQERVLAPVGMWKPLWLGFSCGEQVSRLGLSRRQRSCGSRQRE